ncbi:MAG: MBOAT family protein [Leptospiraceae bacterium]|nr:MBOAT family protein [Leptospiraceae bacterium]
MTFTSFHFLAFFFITLFIGHLLKGRWQRIFLLIASYYFYGVYEPVYLWLILASSFYDYFAALGIEARRSKDAGQFDPHWSRVLATISQRAWLWVSMVLNLSLLGYFKYTNFGIEMLNDVSPYGDTIFSWPTLNILLPIGISFYTFQSLSYTIDVYRGDLPARRDLVDFFLYVAFFPQLVAGPIVRASTFFESLDERLPVDLDSVVVALSRIVVGFFRKLVIADNLGVLVNQGFQNYASLSPLEIWLVAWSFGFQIYFDFAGYTDIARGVARLFGFEFNINFLYPMASFNIKEHWQRWHISLTTWIRDYVYIPLGGSRVSKGRYYFNIFIIWFLTGIWHGPAYHFVAWGVLQGFWLILHQFYSQTGMHARIHALQGSASMPARQAFRAYRIFSHLFLLFCLFFGFIYFRAPDMQVAHVMIGRGFGLQDLSMIGAVIWSGEWTELGAALQLFQGPGLGGLGSYWYLLFFVMFYEHFSFRYQLEYFREPERRLQFVVLMTFMILAVILFALPDAGGFIYFAF